MKVKNKNKVLLSGLISVAVLGLTACGGDSKKQPVPQDKTAPIITLSGDETIIIEEGDTYIEEGASATDNIDPSVEVVMSGYFDKNTAGRYTTTYTATDLAGNTSTKARSITVIRPASFNTFDGVWNIVCEDTDNSNLNDLNITHVNKIFTIAGRDAKFRVRGFNNSTCSGTPLFKGSAYANMVYSGKVITSGHTAENIDITLTEAHYSGLSNSIKRVTDKQQLAIFANKLDMPNHDMLARETRGGSDILLHGLTNSNTNGSSNQKRPNELNVTNIFYK